MPPSPRPPESLSSSSVRLWTWAVVAFSLAVCAAIAWLHYSQEATLHRSGLLLKDYREARVDLAKGLLHLTVTAAPRSPLGAETGLALLERAVAVLSRTGEQLDPDAPTKTVFQSRAGFFHAQVLAYTRAEPAARPNLEQGLHAAFQDLEQLAQQVDSKCQERQDILADRLRARFVSTLIASVLVLGVMCLGVNQVNRRHQRAEAALQRSEAHLRALVSTLPDLVWLKDPQGVYLACNPRFESFFGAKESDIVGGTDYDFKPREAADSFRANDAAAVAAGGPRVNEEEVSFAVDGHKEVLETIKTPMFDKDGSLIGVLGIGRNITERVAREAEIKRLTRLYAVLTQINQAIVRVNSRAELFQQLCEVTTRFGGFKVAWVGWVDPQTRQVVPVARAGDDTGYLDEIKVYADDRPEGQGPIGTCIRTGKPYVVNDFLNAAEGLLWREAATARGLRAVAAFPIHLKGEVRGAFTVYNGDAAALRDKEIELLAEAAMDVDYAVGHLENEVLRQQTERALRERDALFGEMSRIAHVGGWGFDPVTGRGAWTDEVARIHDLDPAAEATVEIGLSVYQGESRRKIEAALREAIEAGTPYDLELEILTVKGNRKWVRTIGSAEWQGNRVVRVHGAMQDITERKMAEAALRASEANLQNFLNTAATGLVRNSRDLRYVSVNTAYARLLDRPVDRILGRTLLEVLGEKALEAVRPYITRVLAGERVEFEAEVSFASVGRRWIHVIYEPDRAADGEITGWVGSITDVSVRKDAEFRLRNEEAALRGILNATRESVWLFGADGTILMANEMAARRYGKPLGQVIGSQFRDLMPEVASNREAHLMEVIRSGHPLEFEDERAGMRFHHSLYPVPGISGEVGAVVCYSQDITERKKAEAAARADAERLTSVLNAQRDIAGANIGYAALLQLILERMSHLTEAEGASLELAEGEEMVYQAATGLAAPFIGMRLKVADSLSGLCMTTGEVMRSDDTEGDARVDRAACRRVGLRSMCLLPLRYGQHSLGVLKVMSSRTAAFSPSVEQTLRLMGEFLSATVSRKRAEMSLRESEALLRTMGDNIPGGAIYQRWMLPDGQNGYRYMSRGIERIFGMSAGQVMAEPAVFLALVVEEDRPMLQVAEQQSARELTEFSCEFRQRTLKGEVKWIHARSTPRRLEDGSVLWDGVASDITERKRTEEEREVMVRLLRMVNTTGNLRELIRDVTSLLQECFHCDAVGIRLRDGEDYPYFETRGFPAAFVRAENHLCERDDDGQPKRDNDGNPVLECMCGNVLCGRFNPEKPFFSPRGSFWSNDTTHLLATTSPADRQANTRNRCNGQGYESVALVALRAGGSPLGLLQLNDKHRNRFTPERIALLERIADSLAISLAHRQDEARLRQSEEQFRAIFELASIGMAQADPATARWLRVNQKFCAITGYSEAELLGGLGLSEVTHPDDRARDQELFRRVVAGEAPDYRMEQRYRRKDGTTAWVSVNMAVLRDADGGPLRTTATIEDITDRKRLEEERLGMEARMRQQQKLESIGTLASGVAHEINNPINGILNYAQIIQDRLPADSSLAEFTGEIMRETQRVATIVRNLLTFARTERQSHSPARIADIIDAALSLVRAVIRHDQITFESRVPDDLPIIQCRSQQIQQVIMNLITNARDALNERYPGHDPDKVMNLEARVLLSGGRSWIRLTVEDHGAGISPEVRDRIFDPFFTTKGRDKGTGLGLSISHGIVKEHHGEWTVESEPGRFTRMHVDLPADDMPV